MITVNTHTYIHTYHEQTAGPTDPSIYATGQWQTTG